MRKKRNKKPSPQVSDTVEAAAPPVSPPATRKDRRGFLKFGWLVLGGLAVAEAVWVFTSFLKPRSGSNVATSGEIIVAGPAEEFENGTVTPVPRGRFYLVRLEDGGFLALARECTHLGCTVPWVAEEQRFVCPCHASVFDLRGAVLTPPAPRALDLYEVRIENREVKVNTGKRLKRTTFSKEQVVYV